MTIFFQLDAGTLPNGTTMVSQGFTEYPALNPDFSPQPDPQFRMSGGMVISNAYPGAVLSPRLIKRLGSPIIRGELRIAMNERAIMLASPDARQWLSVERGYYNATHALIFDHWIDGQHQQSVFRYHALYPGVGGLNHVQTLPSEVDMAWVVDGTSLRIEVNGVRQLMANWVGGGFVDALPIPSAIQGSDGAGYWPLFDNFYAFPLTLRDNADLFYCNKAEGERFDTSTSRLKISGTCSKAGVSQISVAVQDSTGASIYTGTAPVSAGKWQLSTGQIAKALEPATFVANLSNGSSSLAVSTVRFGTLKPGQVLLGVGLAANTKILSQTSGTPGGPGVYQMSEGATQSFNGRVVTGTSELKITATNVGGTPEPREVLQGVSRTLVKQPVRIGNNLDVLDYYTGWWPFNDLARAIEWRTAGNHVLPPWADPAHFNGSNGYGDRLPASTLDLAPNGSPRKFPDDPHSDARAQLPWYPEPGDYVMDMTQAPNLLWYFANTAGKVTVEYDFYGAKLHKVSITEPYIPVTGLDGFRINLVRDPTKPNNGMPTTAWTLSIRKAGSDPAVEWNDSFLDYIKQCGLHHYRWMSGMMAIGPAGIPRNITTGALRATTSDQSWLAYGGLRPQIPYELLVDLHNRTGKHLWLNLPRSADEAYIRALVRYVRDHLDPSLMFIWTMANEVWNYSQQSLHSYRDDGLKIGLGKGRSCTAEIASGSTTVNIATALYGPVEIGQRITGKGIPANTFITGFGTGAGRTGTYTMSNPASETLTIDAVYDAATYGGDGSYDYSAAPAWTEGMSVTAGQVINFINIYRSRVTETSTGNPVVNTDWSKWDLVQSGDQAARRSHIEHMLAVKAIITDEFGGSSAYNSRCQLVAEIWENGFDQTLPTYLDWGNLRSHIVAVAGAPYFGNENPVFNWINSSAEVRNATLTLTGPARRNVWAQAATAEALNVVARHASNARKLVDALEERGMLEGSIQYWTYEGGPEYSFRFDNPTLASTGHGPIDQTALRLDIIAFHREDHFSIVKTFYEGLFDVCGGTKTHFDSFSPMQYYYQANTTGYLHWGISQDMYDRAETSSKYRALRDLSLTYGGGSIPPPTRLRRRRNPVFLTA